MALERVKSGLNRIQTNAEEKVQRDQDLVKFASAGKLIPGSVLSRTNASLNRKERLLVTTRRALTKLGVK
ncbi:MAG: hypothetical protein WCX64_00270 [Candidatus Micrarchaeia archaeon]